MLGSQVHPIKVVGVAELATAVAADTVTIADMIRIVEGALADVRGEPAGGGCLPGSGGRPQDVCIATRARLRSVLGAVTIADVASGRLPKAVRRLASGPDARSWL